jgi:hypothetical protein
MPVFPSAGRQRDAPRHQWRVSPLLCAEGCWQFLPFPPTALASSLVILAAVVRRQKKRVTGGEMLVGPIKLLFADEISTGDTRRDTPIGRPRQPTGPATALMHCVTASQE